MEKVKELLTKFINAIKGLDKSKKIAICIAIVALIIAIVFGISYAENNKYGILYSGLNSVDAATVTQQLEASGVEIKIEGDTIYVSNLSDCYSEFQQLLRILDYLKANESVKIVVFEGVVNEFWLGVTTGQAAKAAKDFHKMLTTGQIS